MKTKDINNKQEESVKKEWNAPEISELGVDNTEGGTTTGGPESSPWLYIS